MNKLRALKERVCRLINKIRRYPNELRVTGPEGGEYEVDNMILSGPKHTLYYFRFEYILGLIFSCTTVVVTCLFTAFYNEGVGVRQQFTLLKHWLRIGLILHIAAMVPKAMIVWRLFKIPLSNERLIVRRLMLLVRSNMFFWNDKVSFVMYNYHIFGMSKLASANICGNQDSGLYRLCHFIICCFLLRLANLFVRFFVEYYIVTRNITYDTFIDQGASSEDISLLPVSKIGELGSASETEGQWCGICLADFRHGDEVRTFPCSAQHCFHKACTDVWLKKQHVCPYCRKSISAPRPPTASS